MLNAIKPSKKTVILYLLVPVVLFIFTVFVPLVTALVYSFFEWKGGPKKTFIGIANYKQLFQDGVFWQAFGHNIYLVIACIIGQIGIAFVLVLMINSKLVKCKGVHRTFGFFPSTISAVCIGLIWNMIYHNKYGILNWFLKAIGRPAVSYTHLPKKTFPKHNGFSDNPAFFCSILRTYGHRRWMLR